MADQKYKKCKLCGNMGKGLFRRLDKNGYNLLDLHKTVHDYESGQHLFDEGCPSFAVFCIHEGLVKVYKSVEGGQHHVIRLLGSGDILGYRGMLAGEPYAATAEAVGKTTACVIPRDTFVTLMEQSPKLVFNFLSKLAEELRISEEQTLALLYHPVKQRAASLMLRLIEKTNQERGAARIKVTRMRRNEMAQFIGTTPETLSRVLREFSKRGIIDLSYSDIYIIDKSSLEKIARN